MAQIVLFHHALGRTSGVTVFADQLRAAGHTVHTPDLFDGQTFDSIESGLAFVQTIGFEEVMNRGAQAAAAIPGKSVFAGMSLGVVPAQMLAQTSPDAVGALFLYSCVPVSEFGESWPAGVPVQIHGMDADPFFMDEGDVDAARALVASTDNAELFLYPGDQHYFADSTLPSYDPGATELMLSRIVTFLETIDDAS